MKKLVEYQRSLNSPWVSVPSNITQRSLALFIQLGTYARLRFVHEDEAVSIEENKRSK